MARGVPLGVIPACREVVETDASLLDWYWWHWLVLDIGFEESVSTPIRTHRRGRTQVAVCKDGISVGNHVGKASG